VVGDADEHDIWLGSRHLLAGPTRGTFVLTGLSANAGPEVLNAIGGLAIVVAPARVEEAAGTRLTLDKGHIGGGFETPVARLVNEVRDKEVPNGVGGTSIGHGQVRRGCRRVNVCGKKGATRFTSSQGK
jgi:hypothetical protein